MKKTKKEKDFLKLPSYPGGNEAFRKFIQQNLKYPQEAQTKKIEGVVLIEYEVDDMGNVHNPIVVNGIGYGCDEETIRLAKLLKYQKVKNRGIRVKAKIKTKISFKLPSSNISYNYTVKKSEEKENKNSGEKSYNYTIKYTTPKS